jgi:uncharacterized protein YggE
VAPDVAELRLGVVVARPTVEGAREAAASTMAAVLAALDSAGIERRDVRTTILTVNPRYEHRELPPRLVGYELSDVVVVQVRDLARLSEVVDGTLRAGATSMDSLTFDVEDPAPAEREARLAAMAVARARADVLAEAAGLRIVGVADIVEGRGLAPPEPRLKTDRMLMAAADVGTPVEAGMTEVAVTVTVAFRTSPA